jgi:uncharacterized protein
MNLKKKIISDLKDSMKAGDQITRGVLRLLNSDIKNAEIEKGGEAGDNEVIELIKRSVKRRKDSIEQFAKGGRADLVSKEKEELAVLEKYMPEQMSEEEIRKIVKKVIAESGAPDASAFGKIIGAVMKETAGNADGNLVSGSGKEELK